VFRRGLGGKWELEIFEDGQAAELKSLDVKLDIGEIYADPNA
jgi:hypothetical protein